MRHVVVFDAADLAPESAFWAAMLGGRVFTDDRFHSVFDAGGAWRIGVQLAPDHQPPHWPDGLPQQQVHLDLHVTNPTAAHAQAIALGARLLRDGDATAPEGHRVYADPAGHPFCIGWRHPDDDAVREFVRNQPRLNHPPIAQPRPTREVRDACAVRSIRSSARYRLARWS